MGRHFREAALAGVNCRPSRDSPGVEAALKEKVEGASLPCVELGVALWKAFLLKAKFLFLIARSALCGEHPPTLFFIVVKYTSHKIDHPSQRKCPVQQH